MDITSTKKVSRYDTKTLVITALMASILCIVGPLSLPIIFTPVPLSLTTLIIYILAYVLSPSYATVSVLIYILLGLVGLPIFSGFSGGPAKLVGPTGGYILSFLFIAPICSLFFHKFASKRLFHVLGMIIAISLCYLFGTIWFSMQQHIGFFASISLCVIPFIIGDIIKIIIAVIVGPEISRRIRR